MTVEAMTFEPPATQATPAVAPAAAAGSFASLAETEGPPVSVKGLSKTFGPARVLRHVDLTLEQGEIHALIGENGSGKSTLIKCLSGFYTPDPGSEITVAGTDVTKAVAHCDFAFVHQDLGLVPGLSALENVALVQGFGTGPMSRIPWRSQRARIRALLNEYGLPSDPDTPVAKFGAAERALLAILRVVENQGRPRLLVLDEPTAALPEEGRQRVLDIVKQTASGGTAVLYVSHRLREVLELSKHITVLRDGVRIGTYEADGLGEDDLVEKMVGRELAHALRRVPSVRTQEPAALRVEHLSGTAVDDLSFEVYPGEILSLTGLLGAGQNEVGKLVFGAMCRHSGSVEVSGRPVRADPASAIGAGVAYIPADRINESTLALMSVRENVTLPNLHAFALRGRMRPRPESEYARKLVREFDVRPPDPELKIRQLSGGNQQKAVIGKWLGIGPRVLILDEPTQGVDVGARAAIYEMVSKAADNGTAVVMVDTDLDEVARLSDRVLVIADGRCTAELRGPEITRLRLTQLMNAGHLTAGAHP